MQTRKQADTCSPETINKQCDQSTMFSFSSTANTSAKANISTQTSQQPAYTADTTSATV